MVRSVVIWLNSGRWHVLQALEEPAVQRQEVPIGPWLGGSLRVMLEEA